MNKKYDVIYADPPWKYSDKASSGKRGAAYKYELMDDDQIASLDVPSISSDNSVLFLWATAPRIDSAFWVMRKWGFTYKTFAFVWIKMSLRGTVKWGMGNWTRSNAEFVLLGVKGKPKRASAGVHSVVMTIPGKHSEKPKEVRDRISELTGDCPKIELFAREKVDGWDSIGYGVGTGDIAGILGGKNES